MSYSSQPSFKDSTSVTSVLYHAPPKYDRLPEHLNETFTKPFPIEESVQQRLEILQGKASQIIIDPELSQSQVFRFCAPLFVFASFILSAVFLPGSSLWNTLDDDNLSGRELALVMATAFIGLAGCTILGLLALRLLIWAVAAGIRMFVQKDWRQMRTRKTSPSISDLVFGRGGSFM